MGRNPRRFWKKIMRLQQNNNSIFIYIILIFSMLFWGTSFVFTSILLNTLDPISIIFIRLLLSSAMLWIIVAVFFRNKKIPFKTYKWIAVLAFFEPFIYFLGETYGLQRVSPIITSLIVSTIPVFTAIVMRLFFNAKLTVINFIGIFISLSGVILMLVGKNMQMNVDSFGLILLFIAVLSAVGYGIVLNKLATNVHPVWLIAIQNSFGFLFFLPFYLIMRETPDFNHTSVLTLFNPQWEMWICILALSIFSSSLAFIFYSMSVRQLGVARCSVFANSTPIFTAITSFLLLGEHLTMVKIVGIFVVVFGLILTQRASHT